MGARYETARPCSPASLLATLWAAAGRALAARSEIGRSAVDPARAAQPAGGQRGAPRSRCSPGRRPTRASRRRGRCAAVSPIGRPGWTRPSRRCSIAPPSCSTTADYAGALACAEEATRQAPRSVEAHHNRAIALMRLDRLDEARDAIALALALAPDDAETLEAAADLNINQLPPSADRSALGLEYARRGSRHVVAARPRTDRAAGAARGAGADRSRTRAIEALRRIDAALASSPRLRRRDLRARRRAVRAVPLRRGAAHLREGAGDRPRITRTRSTTSG